ncbi:SGNH/GDSL hydrolase family protein [Bacillus sp. CGMCC 1.16541]|uniref:SGNH/GDSL hydrolase family protein n=1 Tax=Bacillus sp. CGMCC 1.16541 TaxID=2185143 RepID=UPI000D730E15|nr:SGNH/GDSL hydrolase family protein [Bacillus sp. CGMCC 1.16541]
MKVFVNVLATITLITTIVAGQLYWDHQTEAKLMLGSEDDETAKESSQPTEEKTWRDYTSNLPAGMVEKLEQASETGEPMKLVIVGSQSTPKESGWPTLLQQRLDDVYTPKLIEVEVLEYEGMNTLDFVRAQAYNDIVQAQPDVLLFEPFLLNDNGRVGIVNTLENIRTIMDAVTKEVDDVMTILQPSHPIYNAVNYPNEVVELENLAKEKGYEFLNHWEAWPDYKSEEIKDYLSDNQREPSEKGHDVWAKYLVDYFVAS